MAVTEGTAAQGRRVTRRGRETRRRIVAAAAELMFANGVAETTLEDIRSAAGGSGSQVDHYFEDKQALVRAVIDYQADAVLDAQSDQLDRLDTVPGLRAWRDFIVDHQRRLGCRGGSPLGALGSAVGGTAAPGRRRPGRCAAGRAGPATGCRSCTPVVTCPRPPTRSNWRWRRSRPCRV